MDWQEIHESVMDKIEEIKKGIVEDETHVITSQAAILPIESLAKLIPVMDGFISIDHIVKIEPLPSKGYVKVITTIGEDWIPIEHIRQFMDALYRTAELLYWPMDIMYEEWLEEEGEAGPPAWIRAKQRRKGYQCPEEEEHEDR